MSIETCRLKVIGDIGGSRFRLPSHADSQLEKIAEYAYTVGETLVLTAETRNDMGRVLTWRVRANGRPDIVVTENELELWRKQCVIET